MTRYQQSFENANRKRIRQPIYAVKFGYTSEYIQIPDLSSVLSTNIGTFYCRFHSTSVMTSNRFLIGFSNNRPSLYLQADSGLRAVSGGATGLPSANEFTNSYAIQYGNNTGAFSWDSSAGTYALYLNGVSKESAGGCAFVALSNGVENIGRSPSTGGSHNDLIHEVAIFNVKLTNQNITDLHTKAIKPTNLSSCILYHDYMTGSAEDRSGNGNNGVLLGGATFIVDYYE